MVGPPSNLMARTIIMKASLAFELIFYGLLLSITGAFMHRFAPEIPSHFRYAGSAAGISVFLCGVGALCGYGRHRWALLLQTAASILLVVELVLTWRGSNLRQPIGLLFLALILMFSIQLIHMLSRPALEENSPLTPRRDSQQVD